ncbi:hypothetical protein LHJ74_04455 [Streptomyces sp. N2-109]|uniref:Uncharacterized protein n=1 Tax=Streptomyces gossypii TaxID=2883101 RepID=A0ABT2JMT1_9ACTN|nr:hypothetical protein [Streptomyces gossypii]MCT2589191.1 hypothetical protein [Streptomyces gossypii]
MARSPRQVAIDVMASTVRTGDEIRVGGQSMCVQDLQHVPGGAKRIKFASGDILTIAPTTTLTVLRTAEGWGRS